MLLHPVLNALFNEDALVPSKQLQIVRSQLQKVSLEPYIVILLPPIELLRQQVDSETFYHDTYLLSHIVSIDWQHAGAPLSTFNGGNWSLSITNEQVIPGQGFPPASSSAVKISSSRLWSPGLSHLRFNATFLVLEMEGLLLTNDTPRRFSLFASPGTSTPLLDESFDVESFAWSRSLPAVTETEQKTGPTTRRQNHMKHPASELGRTKAQREQNMARFDYTLACLQQDVVSASELADRYHAAVRRGRETLVDGGAIFTESSDPEAPEDRLTMRTIYEYAESKLAQFIIAKLDDLLARERDDVPFPQIQRDLRSLDLSQVEVPGLSDVHIDAYERAIVKSAQTLDRLIGVHDSETICRVFLQSLDDLTDPRLGTVSADTLLGLFMLSVLRASRDTAAVIERNLYFVARFSFRSADANYAEVSAGRLSYTLMVVESVILQLRMERKRLIPLAELNLKAWHALEVDDRALLEQIHEKDPSVLLTRKAGKSILFLAAERPVVPNSDGRGEAKSEDNNAAGETPLFLFILRRFSSLFGRDFLLRDRDMEGRTILMAVLHDVALTNAVLEVVRDSSAFFVATDVHNRSVAHILQEPSIVAVVEKAGHLLNWTQRESLQGDTPLLALARRGLLAHVIDFCGNFWDHIDAVGNSLLHVAVNTAPELLLRLLMLPSCDVNWANSKGRTPLMVAIQEASIELLLQAGADPWYIDSSDAEQTSSPAIRRSLYSHNTDNPVVQNTHRPDERLVFQPASRLIGVRKFDDFLVLKTQLRTMYPFSWLPRFEWLYSSLENNGVGHHFFGAFLWDDAFRVGFWLRLLHHHGTFKSSPPVVEFYSPEKESGQELSRADDGHHNRKISQLDREEVNSITSFCQFGMEQLNTLESALRMFARGFLSAQETQFDMESVVALAETELQKLGKLTKSKFQPIKSHRAASSLPRETVVVLDQLIKSTEDLRHSLVRPINLSHKLAATKNLVVDCRERLQVLAENKSSPSWLIPRLETKRVSDIQSLEDGVSNGRKRVTELEASIREAHFALASELSAFNTFQENEILDQIGKWAQHRLQAARDHLRQLDYGYIPRREPKDCPK